MAEHRLACAACLQVTGVLATRETFMVSIYDYNKDAEDAEKADLDAAASVEISPAASPPSAAIKRNLSGGVTVISRPCHLAAAPSMRAAIKWALPAWALVALLALALVWERRKHSRLLPWPGDVGLAGFGRIFSSGSGASKASVLKQ